MSSFRAENRPHKCGEAPVPAHRAAKSKVCGRAYVEARFVIPGTTEPMASGLESPTILPPYCLLCLARFVLLHHRRNLRYRRNLRSRRSDAATALLSELQAVPAHKAQRSRLSRLRGERVAAALKRRAARGALKPRRGPASGIPGGRGPRCTAAQIPPDPLPIWCVWP
jgi:hypothetical protein